MADAAEEASIESIVEIAPAPVGPRPAGRNIAQLANDSGDYRPSIHRVMGRGAGSAFWAAAMAPMSRAMCGDWKRYAGRVSLSGSTPIIGSYHPTTRRVADYDAQRRGRMTLRVHSNLDLEAQIDANGTTWLDREMTSSRCVPIMRAGFGAEVDRAMKQRREMLVEMGHARRTPDNVIRVPGDLVARLERSEIERVGNPWRRTSTPPSK